MKDLIEPQNFSGHSGFDMVPCGRKRDMTMNFEDTEDAMFFRTSDSSGGEAYTRTHHEIQLLP